MKARKFLSRSALNIAALIVFVCSAFPVYWMVNTSFRPASAIKGDTVHMWPDEFTLRNYSTAWDGGFLSALKVSLSATGITLVVALLFAFIQAWNEFVFALVIMNRPESQTLPIWLRTFVQATKATDWAVVMAGSTLMAIPVVIFFLIVQGRMTSSMVSGAVKG